MPIRPCRNEEPSFFCPEAAATGARKSRQRAPGRSNQGERVECRSCDRIAGGGRPLENAEAESKSASLALLIALLRSRGEMLGIAKAWKFRSQKRGRQRARPAERGDPLLERESRRRRPSGVVGRRRMLPCRPPSLRGDYAALGPSTAVRGRVSLAARAKGRERVASCRKTYLVLLFDERNELKKKRVGLAFAVARVQNRFFFLDSLLPFTTRLSFCPAEASLALWLLSLSCARGVALFCESAPGPPSRACA